jgi:hypothetical protein
MPACWGDGCSRGLVAQWQRRPSAAEMDEEFGPGSAARAEFAVEAAAGGPVELGAQPSAASSTVAVHACDVHAITTVLAQHVHEASCVGPDSKSLPGCGCSPEPLPVTAPLQDVITLPTGWVIPKP